MIVIRVLSPGDWAAWRALRLLALAESPAALADWQGENDREERWRARLAIPGSYNILAAYDGEDAGMASGIPGETEGTVELISMYVSPAGRGRGVGDAIIEAVEARARGEGARTLQLAVVESNERAIRLYRRHGFAPAGEPGELMDDGLRREIVMQRSLIQA